MATAAVSSFSFFLVLLAAAASHLLVLPSAHACPLAFTKCTEYTTSDTVVIRRVEATPYPLHAGKAATFNISATAAVPIPADAAVHFALTQRVPKGSYSEEHVGEVGGYASQGSTTTVVGDFTISQSFNLPSHDHAVIYTCQMDIMQWGYPSSMPTCINFDFTVLPH